MAVLVETQKTRFEHVVKAATTILICTSIVDASALMQIQIQDYQ